MSSPQTRTNHHFDPLEARPESDGVAFDPSGVGFTNDADSFAFFAARGMLPPPIEPPAQFHQEVREKASRIITNYHLLKEILKRHEPKIQKRWKRKTGPQRAKVLFDCWPDMPPTHRPDFAILRKYKGKLKSMRPEDRSAFMWPHINQEDLSKPKALLLLLNARGRHHPTDFAAADGDAMHLGIICRVIVPIFLHGYLMMLNGIKQDDEYGKLLGWHEHEDFFDWMHTRRQFHPGEGLCILEAQDRLLKFLVACCMAILHDIPAEEVISNQHPIEQGSLLPKATVDNDDGNDDDNDDDSNINTKRVSSSLAAMAEEAPYRPPADLDLDRIESLLSARVAHAEDHIWSMREDPSYFADRLVEVNEHGLEMIKHTRDSLELLTELRDHATHLRALRVKHAARIVPEEDLPEEYLATLLKFRHYLGQAAKGAMNHLKVCVPASPPIRDFYVRQVRKSVTSVDTIVMPRADVKMDKTAENLMWLLQTLWEDGSGLFRCRLPLVVEVLDRFLNADKEARAMVSPYVAMIIGDLSIVGECLRQVNTYLPWANGFETALEDRRKSFQKEFIESAVARKQLLNVLGDMSQTPLASLADPSDHKFAYPLGKKRNKENIEKLRRAEACLDAFWNAADDIIYSRIGRLGCAAVEKLLSQPRSLYRTPEWTEPLKQKVERPMPDDTSGADALVRSLSAVYFDLPSSSGTRKKALATSGKVKVKTRGTARAAVGALEPVTLPEGCPEDTQRRLQVNARALKVFRILFYDPAAHTTPGEVAWNDFLHAMTSTGFSAQKLYGSVWHFQPLTINVERSIQFHEPHPGGKIPFLVARRYGRRLNRAYGWLGGMFSSE